mgnify:FL=1
MKHQVQQRQSNFELLRIIAMLMIVAAHLAAHGAEHMNSEDAYVIWNAGSMINKIFSCFLIGGVPRRSYILHDKRLFLGKR